MRVHWGGMGAPRVGAGNAADKFDLEFGEVARREMDSLASYK